MRSTETSKLRGAELRRLRLRKNTFRPDGGRKGRSEGLNLRNRGTGRRKTEWKAVSLLQLTISGGNDEGVPPVPIPNTEVKPFSADGTWLVTARESRSPPDSKYNCCRLQQLFFISRRSASSIGATAHWADRLFRMTSEPMRFPSPAVIGSSPGFQK